MPKGKLGGAAYDGTPSPTAGGKTKANVDFSQPDYLPGGGGKSPLNATHDGTPDTEGSSNDKYCGK